MSELVKPKKLVLIELNEINFEYARKYVDDGGLPAFAEMFRRGVTTTSSEGSYELLEPWIQWVSVHTASPADAHGIFRLGDIVETADTPQVFEIIEAKGYSVGAISPMNAENRLNNPAYFIPDPWTKTPTDGSFWSRILSTAVSQAVNDNANQKITFSSTVALILGLIWFARLKNYWTYLKLALGSRGKSWRKALFLDLFLHDLHMSRWRSKSPDFSVIFLNAGAHIQHHYFFNSKHMSDKTLKNPAWYVSPQHDPFSEMLVLYDRILGEYLAVGNVSVVVATGLSQKPYDRIKYYYRLSNHASFLRHCGIDFVEVLPRMTRDFLISFITEGEALAAQKILSGISSVSDNQSIFGEIDNRGTSLFVTLTYPAEIGRGFMIRGEFGVIDFSEHVAFVAIKNGMHDAKGFYYSNDGQAKLADGSHVMKIGDKLVEHFSA